MDRRSSFPQVLRKVTQSLVKQSDHSQFTQIIFQNPIASEKAYTYYTVYMLPTPSRRKKTVSDYIVVLKNMISKSSVKEEIIIFPPNGAKISIWIFSNSPFLDIDKSCHTE